MNAAPEMIPVRPENDRRPGGRAGRPVRDRARRPALPAAHRSDPAKARLVRMVASQPIGVKKAIALVEVPGCVLVLGLSGRPHPDADPHRRPADLERVRSHAGAAAASFYEQLSKFTAGPARSPADHDE